MRIALAQFDPIVGDIAGNTARMERMIRDASGERADLVVFGELSVVGYPPRDLVRKERFVTDSVVAVETLASCCPDTAVLVGYVRPTPEDSGRALQNVAALLQDGRIQRVHVKALLPTYDVFDETRYFQPGEKPRCFELGGRRIGLSICEDLWDAVALGRGLYGEDPVGMLMADGAEIIVNMAASPFETGKAAMREELFRRQAKRSGAAIVYVNQVGGNDELIFDGGSCCVSPDAALLGRAKSFDEDLLIVDLDGEPARREQIADENARLWEALKLGLRDYVRKCGFASVVFGLSGGIDSALVAALAADALGAENVHCLAMPSRYSSEHSLADARRVAETLGVAYEEIPIETVHAAFEQTLGDALSSHDVAAENIQARIRGCIVMAWSNAYGHLALATGNKSELSVGYCTLYGDMVGGLAPIGDVLKTRVFELARHLNDIAGAERIAQSVIDKPPSAELKPDQTDQDKLPPYKQLDAILHRYVECDETAEQIIAAGCDAQTVERVVRMVDLAEYKRKQAAAVLKVSPRAFGAGRRMPIAQRYR